jgi:hypothetical protein
MRRSMMRNLISIALAGFFAVGGAGSAAAATLSYTGTFTFSLATLPSASGTGGGVSSAVTFGGHLSTLSIPGGAFGPISASLPVTSGATVQSVRLSNFGILTGTMTGISGGPPGGGPMGISGLAKICLFGGCLANVPVPISPVGGVGMGIGGTQSVTGNVALTMQHAPWTVGQPFMTIHSADSMVTTTPLPGGYASPPSATAANSGVLQLVTASKVFTSLTTAFPEFPIFSVLNLHFFDEPTVDDCEPVVTKITTPTTGAGALRNTSTDGAQTAGSSKTRSVTAVVELNCGSANSRDVTVDLSAVNDVGGAAPVVTEAKASKTLTLRGGASGRFDFNISYDKTSCLSGEGPVPKDQGGVSQLNVDAFTLTADATSSNPGGDPGPNADSLSANMDLLCKPSRTTAP